MLLVLGAIVDALLLLRYLHGCCIIRHALAFNWRHLHIDNHTLIGTILGQFAARLWRMGSACLESQSRGGRLSLSLCSHLFDAFVHVLNLDHVSRLEVCHLMAVHLGPMLCSPVRFLIQAQFPLAAAFLI